MKQTHLSIAFGIALALATTTQKAGADECPKLDGHYSLEKYGRTHHHEFETTSGTATRPEISYKTWVEPKQPKANATELKFVVSGQNDKYLSKCKDGKLQYTISEDERVLGERSGLWSTESTLTVTTLHVDSDGNLVVKKMIRSPNFNNEDQEVFYRE